MIINKPQIILQPKRGKDEEHTLQLKSKIKSQKIFDAKVHSTLTSLNKKESNRRTRRPLVNASIRR